MKTEKHTSPPKQVGLGTFIIPEEELNYDKPSTIIRLQDQLSELGYDLGDYNRGEWDSYSQNALDQAINDGVKYKNGRLKLPLYEKGDRWNDIMFKHIYNSQYRDSLNDKLMRYLSK